MTHLAMPLPMDAIRTFCDKWKIRELAVFGSILRDDFGRRSDVDFLYVLEPGVRWGFDIVRMEEELASIVGRRVDLVSRKAIEQSDNWMRRENILSSAEVIHVAVSTRSPQDQRFTAT